MQSVIIDGCVSFQVEKNKYKCVFNVIIISRMPSIRCVSVAGPYGYVTFYVNLMVFFSQWIRPCKIHAGKVTCAPFHPFIYFSMAVLF